MKLLSERLTWAMAEKSKRDGYEVLPADIARAAKSSATSAHHWLNDSNGLSAPKARLLGAYLGVDPMWLESGTGEPVRRHTVTMQQAIREPTLQWVYPDEAKLLSMYRQVKEDMKPLSLTFMGSLPKLVIDDTESDKG